MKPGMPPGCAPGDPMDMIRSRRAVVVGAGVRLFLDIWEPYRERFYAVFINSVWTGINFFAPVTGLIQINLPPAPGSAINSIHIEEVGEWDDFPNTIPNGWAEIDDANSANRLRMDWVATYSQSSVVGDTQISSITITGAKRGRNVAPVPEWAQRGRLYYSITDVSGTYIVRWWAGGLLVAEGSRTGDGALTCTAMNQSGLEIACTITYTGDVAAGDAFVELRWPASFQVHYSTSSLTYPRSSEETRLDNGGDAYVHRTPELAAGVYNYNVLQVDDQGVVQTSISAPSDSPLTVKSAPLPVTGLNITGTATGGLTANWTVGEAGCEFQIFRSDINDPINFGSRSSPGPYPGPYGYTAFDATSYAIGTVSGYAPVDRTSNYTTLVSAFETAAADGNTLFAAAGSSVFDAVETDILAAISTFGTALGGIPFRSYKRQIAALFDQLQGAIDSMTSPSTADWQDTLAPYWGQILQYLGSILDGNPGRYATLSNGAVPGGAQASGSTATGSGPDGSTGRQGAELENSLYAAAQPFVRPGRLRVVVRATKSGVTEKNDTEVEIEFDASGNIVAARPNRAQIQGVRTSSGLSTTFRVGVIEDDAAAVATHVDLYVVAVGSSINLASPSASAALPAAVGGYHEVDVAFTVGAAGHYQIAAVARTAGGVRSEKYEIETRFISNVAPGGVSNLSARVVRGIGVRGEEV